MPKEKEKKKKLTSRQVAAIVITQRAMFDLQKADLDFQDAAEETLADTDILDRDPEDLDSDELAEYWGW